VISYLNMYSISAVFGITSDYDDDGNDASSNNKKQPAHQSNNRAANEKQMKLINFKVGKLTKAYNIPVDKVKAQLKVSDNMKEVDFKAALKRAQDGLDKVQAENNTQGSNK